MSSDDYDDEDDKEVSWVAMCFLYVLYLAAAIATCIIATLLGKG